MTDLAAREKEVAALLDEWQWELGGCMIGGYAVAAYGKPRYSQDLDFAIPGSSEGQIINWLTQRGFEIEPRRKPERPGAFKDAIRLKREPVTIDLLSGYVRDRHSGVVVPWDWIQTRFRELRLLLVSGSTQKPVRVCRPEALWALKLIAGRDQDLGDLFAIASETVDIAEIRSFLASVMNEPLRARLKDEARRLELGKIYADSLSSRFLRTSSEASRIAWSRFLELFKTIVS